MNLDYGKILNTKRTNQLDPIPGMNQVKNNAGGYVFEIDKWKRLLRFLILGSEGGTYYVGQKELTVENTENLLACIKEDSKRVFNILLDVSDNGRAAKQEPTIFAIATLMTYGDNEVKKIVKDNFNKIIRTGTHMFIFIHYISQMRSMGSAIRKSIANWYNQDVNKVEFQTLKYKGRTVVESSKNKWTHKDVLRLAHVKPKTDIHNDLFRYIVKGEGNIERLTLTSAVENLHASKDIELIPKFNIPHECWPNEIKKNRKVWETALKNMPLIATIRNLGRFSALGMFDAGEFDNINTVVAKLTDMNYIKKSRVHPYTFLLAYLTYEKGHGIKGNLSWFVNQKILDALMDGFYKSFGNVESTGKKILIGLDVSGSMEGNYGWGCQRNPLISPAQQAALMSMVTARSEQNYAVMAFADIFKPLNITPKTSFKEIMRKTHNMNFGRTDCSLPMRYAVEKKLYFDTFIVYTDNETWYGNQHPIQALKEYRNKVNPNAQLIVVAFDPTKFSIADPYDAGMLDVVGFDSATPRLISEFIKGNI